jgi:hypothetical protein
MYSVSCGEGDLIQIFMRAYKHIEYIKNKMRVSEVVRGAGGNMGNNAGIL